MKYFSEKTNKVYDTVEALNKAEFELKEAENRAKIKAEREKAEKEKLAAERKSRAAEVEEARKQMLEAQKAYKEKLERFCRDYGAWHTSISTSDVPSLFDLFSWF